MKNLLIIASLTLSLSGFAASDKMLAAVATVESSNNPRAIGDNGLARGAFQMHSPAWEQVSDLRKAKGKPVYSWFWNATDPVISKEYASDYIDILSSSLQKKMGRVPEPWEVYAAYNRGLQAFVKSEYDYANQPYSTQRACRKIAILTRTSIPQR